MIRAKIFIAKQVIICSDSIGSNPFAQAGQRRKIVWKMSDDGDSFQLDDNDDAEPITAQKVRLFLAALKMPPFNLNSFNTCKFLNSRS